MKSCRLISLQVAASHLSERGAIFPELGMVVPLLMLIVFGVLDVGQGLQTYVNLTRVVYEGARIGGSIASLEANDDDNATPAPAVWTSLPFDMDSHTDILQKDADLQAYQQWLVQKRVLNLIRLVYQLPLNEVSVSSRFIVEDNPTNPTPTTGFVTVTVSAKYRSLLSGLQVPISTSFTGPYMASAQACDAGYDGALGTEGNPPSNAVAFDPACGWSGTARPAPLS